MLGLLGANASPMRPNSPFGIPSSVPIFFQVSPLSYETCMPDPSPPE